MFFMIKRRIDLDFHVNFSDKLNNTSYLYGSIFNKSDETLQYVLYKDDKAIYKLNEKFEIIEQTTINGDNYLLVCDSDAPEDEADAYILREKKNEDSNDAEVIYDEVVDDIELQAVAKVFAELLDDCDIQVD